MGHVKYQADGPLEAIRKRYQAAVFEAPSEAALSWYLRYMEDVAALQTAYTGLCQKIVQIHDMALDAYQTAGCILLEDRVNLTGMETDACLDPLVAIPAVCEQALNSVGAEWDDE